MSDEPLKIDGDSPSLGGDSSAPLVSKPDEGGTELPAVPPKPARTYPRSTGLRAGKGGTYSHRPGCRCNPCKARRRKEEAVALATRIGGSPLQPPPLITPSGEVRPPRPAPKALRERVAQYLHLSAIYPTSSKKDIAELMKLTPAQLREIIRSGTEAGLLQLTDSLERLEHVIIPKTVENLEHYLNEKDRAVTIEVAKGTLFKQFAAEKGFVEGSSTVLALKIETPESGDIKVATGRIVGVPKLGTIIDANPLEDPDEA